MTDPLPTPPAVTPPPAPLGVEWLEVAEAVRRSGFSDRHVRRDADRLWSARGLARWEQGGGRKAGWLVRSDAHPKFARVLFPASMPFDMRALTEAQRRTVYDRERILAAWRAAVAAGLAAGRTRDDATAEYIRTVALVGGSAPSRRTLELWEAAYRRDGRAGLVDRRSVRTEAAALGDDDPFLSIVRERYLTPRRMSLARCWEDARLVARERGIGERSYDQVKRFVRGLPAAAVLDLDRWLEDEAKREDAPKPTDFVWTRVAQEVLAVAEAAIELRTIGLVYGDTGVGKTIALQAVAAEKPGSVFVSVETGAASAHGLIDAIGKRVRASTHCRYGTSRYVLDRVKEELRGTSRLLIVDEVHKLCSDGGNTGNDRALHVIRDLHDHTGVPVLLSGTTDLVAYLERRQTGGREPLGQIRSRIGVRRDLNEAAAGGGGPGGGGAPLFTTEEVRRVFAKSKMRLAADAVRYLMQLANLPGSGGLRACKNIVVMATKVHQGRAAALTADMLRSVHAMLVNRRAFDQVEARMEEARPKAAAKLA